MENEESLKNLLFNPIPGFESIHGENALKEYNKYILSKEFQEEYKKLNKRCFPNADEANIFDDVIMFDEKENPIRYKEYIKIYGDNADGKWSENA